MYFDPKVSCVAMVAFDPKVAHALVAVLLNFKEGGQGFTL